MCYFSFEKECGSEKKETCWDRNVWTSIISDKSTAKTCSLNLLVPGLSNSEHSRDCFALGPPNLGTTIAQVKINPFLICRNDLKKLHPLCVIPELL